MYISKTWLYTKIQQNTQSKHNFSFFAHFRTCTQTYELHNFKVKIIIVTVNLFLKVYASKYFFVIYMSLYLKVHQNKGKSFSSHNPNTHSKYFSLKGDNR